MQDHDRHRSRRGVSHRIALRYKRFDPFDRAGNGEPSIGKRASTPQTRVAVRSDPDWNRTLDRQWADPGVIEPVPLPRVADRLLCPERAKDGNLFLNPTSAVAIWLVENREFLRELSETDAEPQSPARQHIDLRRLLRDQRRLSLWQHKHTCRQFHTPGHSGEKAEQYERLVKPAMRVQRAKRADVLAAAEPDDVLVCEDVIEAEGFDSFGPTADDVWIATEIQGWKPSTEAYHTCLFHRTWQDAVHPLAHGMPQSPNHSALC
jgi:hypothetical protein